MRLTRFYNPEEYRENVNKAFKKSWAYATMSDEEAEKVRELDFQRDQADLKKITEYLAYIESKENKDLEKK